MHRPRPEIARNERLLAFGGDALARTDAAAQHAIGTAREAACEGQAAAGGACTVDGKLERAPGLVRPCVRGRARGGAVVPSAGAARESRARHRAVQAVLRLFDVRAAGFRAGLGLAAPLACDGGIAAHARLAATGVPNSPAAAGRLAHGTGPIRLPVVRVP